MKIEKGSFSPSQSLATIVLNDDTLEANRIIFWCEGTYPSHGYDDMTRQVAAYGGSGVTKNDRSIYVYNTSTSTVVQSGRVTGFHVGEIDVTFDSYNATQVGFIAIED